MEDLLTQTNYALDTFYFLLMGVLVMFMACGFSMLEAGMIRAKNTSEILTKNVALYSISCIMYLLIGYNIMYMDAPGGGILPSFGFLIGVENTTEQIIAAPPAGSRPTTRSAPTTSSRSSSSPPRCPSCRAPWPSG